METTTPQRGASAGAALAEKPVTLFSATVIVVANMIYLFIERPLPSVFGLTTVASGLLLYKLLAAATPVNLK